MEEIEFQIIKALEGLKEGHHYKVLNDTIALEEENEELHFIIKKEGERNWKRCCLNTNQVYADWILIEKP